VCQHHIPWITPCLYSHSIVWWSYIPVLCPSLKWTLFKYHSYPRRSVCTVQPQHVFPTQRNDPSYLLSAMFLTLFVRMRVKAVRCVLWQKLSTLHWACESGFQAFCPTGVWSRHWSGLFPRPLQFGPCSSNLISTAACCTV